MTIIAQQSSCPKNSLVEDKFIEVIDAQKKNQQHQCIHCGHQATKNAQQGQIHLNLCKIFLQLQKAKEKSIPTANRLTQLSITTMIRPLSQQQLQHTYQTATVVVYMINLFFNHYKNDYI